MQIVSRSRATAAKPTTSGEVSTAATERKPSIVLVVPWIEFDFDVTVRIARNDLRAGSQIQAELRKLASFVAV
jgi:hypothetical protein